MMDNGRWPEWWCSHHLVCRCIVASSSFFMADHTASDPGPSATRVRVSDTRSHSRHGNKNQNECHRSFSRLTRQARQRDWPILIVSHLSRGSCFGTLMWSWSCCDHHLALVSHNSRSSSAPLAPCLAFLAPSPRVRAERRQLMSASAMRGGFRQESGGLPAQVATRTQPVATRHLPMEKGPAGERVQVAVGTGCSGYRLQQVQVQVGPRTPTGIPVLFPKYNVYQTVYFLYHVSMPVCTAPHISCTSDVLIHLVK